MNLKSKFVSLSVVISICFGTGSIVLADQSVQTAMPFNKALNFSYNPNATGLGGSNSAVDLVSVTNTSPVTTATSTYSETGEWGSVNGYAQADLATGTLKIQSSASGISTSPYMQTNASFGDSFTTTTTTGTPFSWSGSTATFTMSLSGSLASTDSFNNEAGFVFLAILQKNTLDPNMQMAGPDTIEYFLWDLGNPDLQIYYTDTAGNSMPLTVTQGYTQLPSNISAIFAPGGDFDWMLLIGASGQPGQGQSFDIDLSHTVTLNYTGPDGSITTSDSGQFNNFLPAETNPTPEPSTMLLFAAGLGGLAAVRRKKMS